MAQHSRNIYQDSVAIDALNVSNWDSPAVYRSLKSGGVTGINATIAIWEGFAETMDNIAGWMARFREYEDVISQAKTASDILQAKEEGKTGVVFGWQNTAPIGGDLKRLELFHALGVRIVQITYNERNLVGNGCYERNDNGLSNFGLDVVKELNRLVILIDLSHVGDQTSLEAADLSEQPVACTHANARSMFDHPRNKTDELLKLVSERGGVIGANAYPPFLANGFRSTVSDFVDVIDDLVERVGIDHVGIGTDYCQDQPVSFFDWIFSQQGTKPPSEPLNYPDPFHHPLGMETPDGFGSIALELSNRGYAEPDIANIIGGNWMRLFREVWGE
ncbi:MAG: dipeptidase [SAR202 cluster bacterium]|nr:dipeptidase [SAR202 cluster bacterium]